MEYAKAKPAAKYVLTRSPKLRKTILETMKLISDAVGVTLGPNGRPVLIERYEHGLPCVVTKDGVTVFRALALPDPAGQCILETARDSAIRTVVEAGDGTTTATILGEALIRNIDDYCTRNPRVSPQKILRQLESVFRDEIEPTIRKLSRKLSLDNDGDLKLLHAVARISANGDTELADAVMRCFELTGDEGSVTIVEANGPPAYETEALKGFAIPQGYEHSCKKFYPKFINDPGRQITSLEKPIFLLYHGRISEIQNIVPLMERVGEQWQSSGFETSHNVVIVATGFSDTVIAHLAVNFPSKDTINVFPLEVPMSLQSNGQMQFLLDLSAITGAKVLDPLSSPLEQATLEDLGPGVEAFEASRYRSTVIGHADETLLLIRSDEIQEQLKVPESELDSILLKERLAKLLGGIARLRVVGVSTGEIKEKRDRAEDAVCAVRGAIKHGCLPGGAWTLLKMCNLLPRDPVIDKVLRTSFMAPFDRLLQNCGIVDSEEAQQILGPIIEGIKIDQPVVYDFLNHIHVDAYEAGILDSTPAVLEAIRASLSICQLGTTGAVVAFPRNAQLELSEAQDTAAFLRDSQINPADERW